MGKPFGIDVSRHDSPLDWDAIAQHDPLVEFVGIRATISWGYIDAWFAQNWREAKRVGIPRAAYHVVYPDQSVDSQIDHFLQIVGSDLGEFPLVLDVELNRGVGCATVRSSVLGCSKKIQKDTGRKPIIYSRASFVDYYVTGQGFVPPSWLNEHDWWLAQYLKIAEEHPGPPDLPRGVNRERVIIHQTSDKAEPFGLAPGTICTAFDYNRWQLDQPVSAYLGREESAEVDFTRDEKTDLMWAAHPELHVKKGV